MPSFRILLRCFLCFVLSFSGEVWAVQQSAMGVQGLHAAQLHAQGSAHKGKSAKSTVAAAAVQTQTPEAPGANCEQSGCQCGCLFPPLHAVPRINHPTRLSASESGPRQFSSPAVLPAYFNRLLRPPIV